MRLVEQAAKHTSTRPDGDLKPPDGMQQKARSAVLGLMMSYRNGLQ